MTLDYAPLVNALLGLAIYGEEVGVISKEDDVRLQLVAAHGASIARVLELPDLAHRLEVQAIACHSCR